MNTNSDKRIILLVDDKPANIQVAHNILKDTYTIKIATSGAKALDLATALPQPDLILLDIMMPEMDGYEVCSQLKSNPGTRDIPIVFLTGKTDAEDETKGFELGAIDYIHKPLLTTCGSGARSDTPCVAAKPASRWRKKNVKWIASSTTSFLRRRSPRSS